MFQNQTGKETPQLFLDTFLSYSLFFSWPFPEILLECNAVDSKEKFEEFLKRKWILLISHTQEGHEMIFWWGSTRHMKVSIDGWLSHTVNVLCSYSEYILIQATQTPAGVFLLCCCCFNESERRKWILSCTKREFHQLDSAMFATKLWSQELCVCSHLFPSFCTANKRLRRMRKEMRIDSDVLMKLVSISVSLSICLYCRQLCVSGMTDDRWMTDLN